MNFIYTLICPIRKKPFYVGVTQDPLKRLTAHRSVQDCESKQSRSAYESYLYILRKHGCQKNISMQILEDNIPCKEKKAIEKYWIQRVAKLSGLMNLWHYTYSTEQTEFRGLAGNGIKQANAIRELDELIELKISKTKQTA